MKTSMRLIKYLGAIILSFILITVIPAQVVSHINFTNIYVMKIVYLLLITKAPITPGTQPQQVSIVTMTIEPQPLSSTASGGKMIHNKTRNRLM